MIEYFAPTELDLNQQLFFYRYFASNEAFDEVIKNVFYSVLKSGMGIK